MTALRPRVLIAHGMFDLVTPYFATRMILDQMPEFAVPDIRVATVMVPMRDGVRLATDVYLPPRQPAPAVVMRTPYERDQDANVGAFMSLARRGFAVVAQDCRGTGGSEPDFWDYYVREPEDSYDVSNPHQLPLGQCKRYASSPAHLGDLLGL